MQTPSSSAPPPRKFFSLRTLGLALVALAALATLIGLFYAEEDWRGKHAWNNYRREAEARGIELNWQKFIPPPVPDDQNFATTPFLAPLLDFNPRPFNGSPWRDSNAVSRAQNFAGDFMKKSESIHNDAFPSGFSGHLTGLESLAAALQKNSSSSAPISTRGQAAAFILENLRPYDAVLEELRAASQRPYSRFNVRYDDEDPAGILLPHLGVLNRVTQILRLRASSELALNQTDAAFEDAKMMFRLGNSIHSEPIIISQLVRNAILNTARQIIWEGLDQKRWSDAQLASFQTNLAGISLLKDARWAMDSERVGFGVNLYKFLRDHPAFLLEVLRGPENPGEPQGDVLLLRWAPMGWLYQEQISHQRFFDNEFMDAFNADSTQVHPRTIDQISAANPEHQKATLSGLLHHRVLLRFLAPSLGKVCQKAAVGQAGADETLIACALERYHLAKHEYPEKLSALVPQYLPSIPLDICNGEPMKYRRTDDGRFILYSVGWNEKDDGGLVVTESAPSPSKDFVTQVANRDKTPGIDILKGDWVWPDYSEK